MGFDSETSYLFCCQTLKFGDLILFILTPPFIYMVYINIFSYFMQPNGCILGIYYQILCSLGSLCVFLGMYKVYIFLDFLGCFIFCGFFKCAGWNNTNINTIVFQPFTFTGVLKFPPKQLWLISTLLLLSSTIPFRPPLKDQK